ncbi:hypothetical protein C2G38_2037783 [Gigaspora rosea]|uniref:Uncharacterized protein n=1 Tax=Gigaspora rosea TaxID=44941 RepID=A0A397V6Y4_9GLOM|nr:hypothetical protein C2G38_2037783 [Gigaspora rosea]
MTFSIDNYDIFNYINNEQEDEINLGISYLKLGYYVDSLDQFNFILDINSNNLTALILRGIAYFKLKKYANALSDAHRSIEIEPTSPSSLILRGETYFMLGKFNEALIDFNKALEINPNNAYVLSLSGEIYLKFQLYCKALRCFKIASEFDHSNTESLVHSNNALQKLINTLLFHGETFYLLKQYDKALLYYDKVLEIDPFNLIASSFRGKVYYSLRQYYKPFLNLNKALDINPHDIAILLYRGEAYKAFSDLEKVLEQYDEDLYNIGMSLEIKSNYTNALILQAKICFNLEKYSDTIQFLSKALEIGPKNKIILTLRGGLQEDLLTCINKILDIEQNNPYALCCRSEIWFRLEQYNKVLDDLNKSLKIEPDFVTALILRGITYFSLRKYDEAHEDFSKVSKIEPNNETTVKYLIDAFNGFNFTSMKRFIIKSSKKFEINNITAIILCGEEYFIRGQFDYALLYFNKSLEINPNDKTALILSAKIFFTLKKYENAIKYLNEILKVEPDNDIALFYRSEANFKLGRRKESHLKTEKLSKILEIEFNNAFILYNT